MNTLAGFHFIRPVWLLLMPFAVILWWLVRGSQDPIRGWRTVIEPQLLSALTTGRDKYNYWGRSGLLVGWMLSVIAIAGPTWRPEPSPFADDPVPVMILLRAGETMNQSDFLPSRMDRARLKVRDLAAERKGQPLGLITYAGSAHLVLPPTRDTSVVAEMAAEISPEILPKPGDNLAEALQLAASTLGDSGGSIVVFADKAPEEDISTVAKFRSENKLSIYFLAVARVDTPEYEAIRSCALPLSADVVLMTPDEEDVRKLARSAGGAPVSIDAASDGVRWAEAGWWLVPPIALLSLIPFRRLEDTPSTEAA